MFLTTPSSAATLLGCLRVGEGEKKIRSPSWWQDGGDFCKELITLLGVTNKKDCNFKLNLSYSLLTYMKFNYPLGGNGSLP